MKYTNILLFLLYAVQVPRAQEPFSKNIDVDGYSDGGTSVHEVGSGYLLTATSLCNNNISECFTILNTDASGNVTHQVQYQNFPWWILAGSAYGNIGVAIDETAGNYFSGSIQPATQYYDVFLMKTNQYGDSLWLKTYGTALDEGNRTIIFNSDTSLMLLNTSVDGSKYMVWLLHVDLEGNVLWEDFLGEGYKDAIYQDIIRLENGDIVVSYLTSEFNVPSDPYSMTVTRLDPHGNEKWTSRFASYNGLLDGTTSSILELDGEGFLVNYKRQQFSGFYKRPPILVWLDSLGNVLDQYNFSDFTELVITDLIKTSNGLIAGCGYADLRPPVLGDNDYGFAGWVFAFTQGGEMLWERYIVDLNFPDKFSYFSGLEETADKGFVLTGGIDVPGPGHDIWLVKLDSMGCLLSDECADGLQVLTHIGEEAQVGRAGFVVYPNPVSQGVLYIDGGTNFHNKSGLEIRLVDLMGRKIKSQHFEEWMDISDLQKGVYVLTIEYLGEKLYVEKICVL